MYPIYILSRFRSQSATTPKLLEQVPYYLVIHPSEEKEYKINFPEATLLPTIQQKSVSHARQFILDDASQRHPNSWIWMLDDDILKCQVMDSENKKTKPATMKQWLQGMEKMVKKLKLETHQVCQVGCQHTMFNYQKKILSINTGFGAVQLLHIPTVQKLKLKYDTNLVTLEDTDFIAQIVLQQHYNVKFNQYIFYSQPAGQKNKKGGLAKVYSDNGKQKGILEFQKKYPTMIRLDKDNVNKYRINWSKYKNKLLENELNSKFT